MVVLQPITTKEVAYYTFVEDLMSQTFPREERRSDELQRVVTDEVDLFFNHVILHQSIPIGLMTYWDFGDFVFIEHFAISQLCRGRGFGKESLLELMKSIAKPIVLEVELPTDVNTQRRIDFYKGSGFEVWDFTYHQPPYRDGDQSIPMLLMGSIGVDGERHFQRVQKLLYFYVYRVGDNEYS